MLILNTDRRPHSHTASKAGAESRCHWSNLAPLECLSPIRDRLSAGRFAKKQL